VILEATDWIAEAANGAEAVQAAAEHNPDVIPMDVRMPEIDGLEATS
jgi:CheY-like chemotaxis protein